MQPSLFNMLNKLKLNYKIIYSTYSLQNVMIIQIIKIIKKYHIITYNNINKMKQRDNLDDYEQQCQDTTRRTYTVQMKQKNQQSNGIQVSKKKYGNMLVLYDGQFLISLGPDYLCFIPTFLIFCAGAFFMIRFMFLSTQNVYLILATIFICGGACLSYLLVATSNPGIITQSQSQSSPEQSSQSIKKTKVCRRCNITVKRSTYHCVDCDVCISQYDHHCPWTSKCIGGGNLFRFYAFVTMIPIFLIYCFIAFGIMMAQNAIASNKIQNIAKGL